LPAWAAPVALLLSDFVTVVKTVRTPPVASVLVTRVVKASSEGAVDGASVVSGGAWVVSGGGWLEVVVGSTDGLGATWVVLDGMTGTVELLVGGVTTEAEAAEEGTLAAEDAAEVGGVTIPVPVGGTTGVVFEVAIGGRTALPDCC
jgi:hypothetical protein